MKQWMLIGTVGLVLVGAASAQQGEEPKQSVESFKVARDAAIGRAGSAKRADFLAQLRAGVASGDIDPRTMLLMLDGNGLPASRSAMTMPRATAPTEGVPTAPGFIYRDPFEIYTFTNFTSPPGSLISIAGQINPAGMVFGGVAIEYGVADDTTMTEGDNDPLTPVFIPPPGGGIPPAPAVNAGLGFGIDNSPPYLALARRTAQDTRNTAFTLGMNLINPLGVPGATPDTALRMKTDWYLTNKKTNQWWGPYSTREGIAEDRIFFGGQGQGGILGFFSDTDGFLTNFVSLGLLAGNFQIGQFYAPPRSSLFPFPVGEWFEMMTILSSTPSGGIGQGLFIKTPESVANGFLDPRMATGAILPVDGEAAGWVNTYPGVIDDPLTPEIEGLGLATTQFGQIAPTNSIVGLSPPLAAISLGGAHIGLGLDDLTDPLFQPDDAFIDDHVLAGVLFPGRPSPLPDFIIPYADDMELYFPAPVRIQTNRIFDGISSNATITNSQNSTPGGGQSFASTTINNNAIFRQENGETFPTFPQPAVGSVGTDGVPFTNDADGSEKSLVVSAKIRIGESTNTGRAVRIVDGVMTGNFVGSVILGATNPLSGLDAADGTIWIRQPNIGSNNIWGVPPGFDRTKDSQDNLTQGNWIPASLWDPLNPPAGLDPSESDFNTEFTNIPTGVAVTLNAFTSVQFEVQPNPNQDETNPYDEGLMRVTINGAVIANPARPDGLWLAGGFSVSSVQFWSGNEKNGMGDTIHIDDVTMSGPLRTTSAGPVFTAPYTDSFELYTAGESVNGQGDTPFLNLVSLPNAPPTDNARKTTISTKAPTALVPGVTMVCRYQVNSAVLGSGLLNVGDTVVLNFSELPLPFNTLLSLNIDCPGVFGTSTPFIMRPFNAALGTAENQPRVQTGKWTLLTMQTSPPFGQITQFPEPYDPVANPTDIEIFSYSTTTAPRWIGAGTESLIVDDPTSSGAGQVLQIKSTLGVDGSLNNNPDFFAASALMPRVNSAPGSLGVPSALASLSVDIYIESLDAAGNPVSAAPRSRMSIPFFGAGADAGRITTINFGGPNVNNIQTLFGVAPILPADEISFTVDSGITAPDTMFVTTDVSLVAGGLGLGPLLNTWFTLTLDVDIDSNWTASIDEDRSGPNFPVVIATGTARDLGEQGIGGTGTVVDTSNLDFFEIRQGLDLGSGGEPIALANFRVRTLVNNAPVANPQTDSADVTAPFNANKDDDYCFYQTTAAPEFIIDSHDGPLNAKIADESPHNPGPNIPDVFDDHRDLRGSNDVIAIVNRAYDSATNTISGPLLFDPCPVNVTSPMNRFDLYDGPTPANGVLYTGRWELLGQIGQAGVNRPQPAGGLGRIDGPARTPPVSYNDFTVEPPGFPATVASRPIIVCQWGSDAADTNNGVDGFGTVFPRSRWFFDNVNLRATVGPTPCADLTPDDGFNAINAADLAFLLGNWGAVASGNAADINGDGVVNSADLATLLGNWGPCP